MRTRLKTIAWITLASVLAFGASTHAEESLRQGEAAIFLANRLGLGTHTVEPLNEMTAVKMLMENGVTPFAGWQLDESLTVEDLARILVQIMGATDEIPVEERDNPETSAYMEYLVRVRNLDLNRIAIAMAPPGLFARPADDESVATDPLRGRGGEGESADDEGGVFVPVGLRLVQVVLPQVIPSRGSGRRGRPDPVVIDTTPTEPQP